MEAQYSFNYALDDDENGNSAAASRTFSSDYLPQVLEEFREFLRASGWSYVEKIEAICGEINGEVVTHSSDDAY